MPKALCVTGMVVAVLVLLLTIVDLLASFVAQSLAPFGGVSIVMDIISALAAAGLGAISWFTYKEQA